MDIKRQIREIIEKFCIIQNKLGDDDTFAVDSVTFLKIIIEIEDIYHIEFDSDKLDVNNFNTLSRLEQYVRRKIEETSAS